MRPHAQRLLQQVIARKCSTTLLGGGHDARHGVCPSTPGPFVTRHSVRTWRGAVTYVAPTVEEKTRTIKVRVEVDNQGGALKPDMFADVELHTDLGTGLVVPESAIIDTGAQSSIGNTALQEALRRQVARGRRGDDEIKGATGDVQIGLGARISPIRIGDLIILNAEVTYTGRTSMEVEVQVIAENPITGERVHTNTAYLVFVGLDNEGRPTPIPALITETEEEKQRMEQAKKRQAHRISQK